MLWCVISALTAVAVAGVLLHFAYRMADAALALLAMGSLMAAYLLRASSRMLGARLSALLAQMLNLRPSSRRHGSKRSMRIELKHIFPC